jgi:hypothetical protein
MSANHEFPGQIRCLALDSTRMTALEGDALLHNVIIEVADKHENARCGERDPMLVSLSPQQARELASSLWWLAGRSERIAAGIR